MDVSFIIVSMNKPDVLAVCLDSIRRYTQVSYEVLVTAYLYSDVNLSWIKQNYPWIKITENNEISGFSENNNLSLRQAQGDYCFVINDDTELRMPVADRLLEAFRHHTPKECVIVSPKIIWPNGKIQSCGVAPKSFSNAVAEGFHLWHRNDPSPYTNQQGIFRSYNIHGAAFMIRTDVFRSLGWFDERYFFCPEDIALSTLANQRGYQCWVDADTEIVHFEGLSSKSLSLMQTATKPAATRGSLIMYGTTIPRRLLLSVSTLTYYIPKWLVFGTLWFCSHNQQYQIKALSAWNATCTVFSNRSPKEIFIHYYQIIKKNV